MQTTSSDFPISPAALAAAPHRLLFLIGACNVLAAMAWWTAWLAWSRWQPFDLPQPPVFAGWMHAIVMQYQVLPPFIFGFLLTVFPRWMNLPPLSRSRYVPVGVGLLLGQALTLAGLFAQPWLLVAGLVLTIAGWISGLVSLFGVMLRAPRIEWHAVSAALALLFGLAGLLLTLAHAINGSPLLIFVAIKFGSLALLLPIFFTVCHRMIPFFTSCVVPSYAMHRPLWALLAFWVLLLFHLTLELMHAYAWLWLADLPLFALTASLLWRWWPRAASIPHLLRVLFIGFTWLPIALFLFAMQSLWYQFGGEFVFGRAPTHALFIGFFGSLLVAMVTRVTQGHSGRPLELGSTAAFAFAVVQVVALTRIISDLTPDSRTWQVASAALWLLAFTPWVLRSASIYLRPRADGKPG